MGVKEQGKQLLKVMQALVNERGVILPKRKTSYMLRLRFKPQIGKELQELDPFVRKNIINSTRKKFLNTNFPHSKDQNVFSIPRNIPQLSYRIQVYPETSRVEIKTLRCNKNIILLASQTTVMMFNVIDVKGNEALPFIQHWQKTLILKTFLFHKNLA